MKWAFPGGSVYLEKKKNDRKKKDESRIEKNVWNGWCVYDCGSMYT